jgi:hypothetical protein
MDAKLECTRTCATIPDKDKPLFATDSKVDLCALKDRELI